MTTRVRIGSVPAPFRSPPASDAPDLEPLQRFVQEKTKQKLLEADIEGLASLGARGTFWFGMAFTIVGALSAAWALNHSVDLPRAGFWELVIMAAIPIFTFLGGTIGYHIVKRRMSKKMRQRAKDPGAVLSEHYTTGVRDVRRSLEKDEYFPALLQAHKQERDRQLILRAQATLKQHLAYCDGLLSELTRVLHAWSTADALERIKALQQIKELCELIDHHAGALWSVEHFLGTAQGANLLAGTNGARLQHLELECNSLPALPRVTTMALETPAVVQEPNPEDTSSAGADLPADLAQQLRRGKLVPT